MIVLLSRLSSKQADTAQLNQGVEIRNRRILVKHENQFTLTTLIEDNLKPPRCFYSKVFYS